MYNKISQIYLSLLKTTFDSEGGPVKFRGELKNYPQAPFPHCAEIIIDNPSDFEKETLLNTLSAHSPSLTLKLGYAYCGGYESDENVFRILISAASDELLSQRMTWLAWDVKNNWHSPGSNACRPLPTDCPYKR